MTRVLSGVALAAAALAAILFLPQLALRLLACGVAALAEHEYRQMAGAKGLLRLPLAFLACWSVSSGNPSGFVNAGVLMAIAVPIEVLWRGTPIQAAAAGAFGVVYLGVPLGMLAAVHGTFGAPVTLFLIGTIVLSDTAQYYAGRAFGRRPLAPAISPKKTIEGAIGGVVLGTAFVTAVGTTRFGLGATSAIPFGATVVVLGILGDLFESRLKRAADMKDSSNLIPGHGGILDRIDALLFAAPAFYVFFGIFGI